MPAANVLTADGSDIYSLTGTMPQQGYPSDGTSDAIQAPALQPRDGTSACVALFVVVGIAFIIVLRRSGFRDMVAT